MKLPIKTEFFNRIKAGEKRVEYRDAHITFICDATGEELVANVSSAEVVEREVMPRELQESNMFDDRHVIRFVLDEPKKEE